MALPRQHGWLSAREAAEYTGRHHKTILKAAEAGELRGYQQGRRSPWAFQLPDLDRWMRGEQPVDVAS